MRTLAAIAVCTIFSITCTRLAVASDEPQAGSVASDQATATTGDELHFVSVLTLHGEVVAVDPANRLITLKGPNGHDTTLEARSEKELEALQVKDRVVAQYFEGGQIGKETPAEATPAPSLADGLIRAREKHGLVASVANVDAVDQEVTLKGSDGGLETIMVTNPAYLRHIKVGDEVVVTRAQALALSLEKESP